MDKQLNCSPLSRLKPSKRRLIQLYSALLYNAQLKGFVEGQIYTGPLKNICVPGMNCYSCPGAVAGCPLGALQNALASTTTRAPAYMLGILLLFGLTLGRTICSYLCPFGLIQELLHKIPSPKLKKSRVTRALSRLKYVILAVFVIAVPLLYSLQHFPVPAFCKYICPAGTLEGAIGLLSNPNNADKLSMLGILFTRKFIILVVILVGSVFVFRLFCRFLCPLGAIYSLFAKFALIGVKVDTDRCTGCGLCVRQCKVDIRHVGDAECIQCGACAKCCPVDAISWQVGSKKVKSNPERPLWKRVLPWAAALILLGGVLWFVNKPEKAAEPAAPEASREGVSNADTPDTNAEAAVTETADPESESEDGTLPEVGKDAGMLLPDFTASVYGGEPFDTAAQRGKILVINFWATWCTPCVNELPHFEALAAEYADTVSVIALHSDLVTEDVDAWLARENIALTFGLDETGEIIKSLGGSTMLPMTVIVDADGIITYNKVGSVTYETLTGLVREASGE